ncbi:MAG: Crp/Fnr family transcriptional regulator [Bacteroidota bacterium]
MVKKITVKKGAILQRPGDKDTKVFLVKTGLLRSYLLDEKGKEHIFLFAAEGAVMTDHLPSDLPAELYIDALEDTTAVVREKNLKTARREAHKMARQMGLLQKRVVMLMSSSIIDRFHHFVTTYPQIVNRVPQKMIASYLGVTPEALSKSKGQYLQTRQ